jgi:hypothetical protein
VALLTLSSLATCVRVSIAAPDAGVEGVDAAAGRAAPTTAVNRRPCSDATRIARAMSSKSV